jgi:hypothetical protein
LRTECRTSRPGDFPLSNSGSASPYPETKRLGPLVSPGAGKGQRVAAACAGARAVKPVSRATHLPRTPGFRLDAVVLAVDKSPNRERAELESAGLPVGIIRIERFATGRFGT